MLPVIDRLEHRDGSNFNINVKYNQYKGKISFKLMHLGHSFCLGKKKTFKVPYYMKGKMSPPALKIKFSYVTIVACENMHLSEPSRFLL